LGTIDGFYRKLRDRVFGRRVREEGKPIAPSLRGQEAPQPLQSDRIPLAVAPRVWQIGLDFGTCFCKTVCRDVVIDKARAYIPDVPSHPELPFLIPSNVSFDGRRLRAPRGKGTHYTEGGLYHLKLALEQVALGNYGAKVLQPLRHTLRVQTDPELANLVKACAVYLLGGILGSVRRQIRQQRGLDSPGCSGDWIAVNMAIPVADAQRPVVMATYQEVLETAWRFADSLAGHPTVELMELACSVLNRSGPGDPRAAEECFVYPEVFASIQVFVRSRASEPGFYFFSDTGAGTVDQCIFHFIRHDGNPNTMYYPGPLRDDERYEATLEWIRRGQSYLRAYSAAVLPLGSAQIEILAAGQAPEDRRTQEMERWRRLKESNSSHPSLDSVRQKIGARLRDATQQTLRDARRKGWNADDPGPVKIVFGGGGHCQFPYADAVRASLPAAIQVGLPPPTDLDLAGQRGTWMTRLAVAYGLSFQRQQLSKFTFPDELPERSERQEHVPDLEEHRWW